MGVQNLLWEIFFGNPPSYSLHYILMWIPGHNGIEGNVRASEKVYGWITQEAQHNYALDKHQLRHADIVKKTMPAIAQKMWANSWIADRKQISLVYWLVDISGWLFLFFLVILFCIQKITVKWKTNHLIYRKRKQKINLLK